MFYPRNVPNWERLARVVLGLLLLVVGLAGQSLFGLASPLVTVILLFSAAFTVITGFIGWCPACALAGRKIKQRQSKG